MEGICILTDIWCHFFVDDPQTNTRDKLEIMRIIVERASEEDIQIYNYWARKVGVAPIEVLEQ